MKEMPVGQKGAGVFQKKHVPVGQGGKEIAVAAHGEKRRARFFIP